MEFLFALAVPIVMGALALLADKIWPVKYHDNLKEYRDEQALLELDLNP